jgi:hypothetical protein
MLVPESYQESDSSGNDDDSFPEIASRGSGSRGGARSQGCKSRSRSRPSTRDGDIAFMMASDFVQVHYWVIFIGIFIHQNSFDLCVHSCNALQAMQSKPGSRGTALGLDLDETESVGGREPVLTAKLMDDDADVIVRFVLKFSPAHWLPAL